MKVKALELILGATILAANVQCGPEHWVCQDSSWCSAGIAASMQFALGSRGPESGTWSPDSAQTQTPLFGGLRWNTVAVIETQPISDL